MHKRATALGRALFIRQKPTHPYTLRVVSVAPKGSDHVRSFSHSVFRSRATSSPARALLTIPEKICPGLLLLCSAFRRGSFLVAMSCRGQNGWLLDYGLVEEEIHGSDFIYMVDDPAVSSVILGFDAPRKEDGGQDNSGSKKRSRPESSAPPGTKACREKLRRDRLNERFNELCAVLEPGKPPKADKVAILSDAARLLNQLRAEAQKLKSSNESLQDSIKSLKSEKSELRDEKTKLKAERDRLEQMLKGVSAATAPTQFVPQPAAAATPWFHPAAAFAQAGKFVPAYTASYPPPAAFWQWIPPTYLDTSKDPVHWPPVA